MPKIVIAGAGIAGSYLCRLLVRKGMNRSEIEIVDPGSKTRCGIAPCGFVVMRQFFPLCEEVGLDPEKYILKRHDVGYLGRVKIKPKGYAFSIDKPAFIRDLVEGIDVASSTNGTAAQRIIDATGTARAYIGRYDADILLPTLQMRVKFAQPPPLGEYPHRGGYSWVLPLEDNSAHVGVGSATYDSDKMKKTVAELARGAKAICSCRGYVRGTGPILPLVRGNVWVVGEAGGIVDPLSGGGIVPAMVSAKLIVEHWDDPQGYEAAVLREYGWFRKTSEFAQTWRDKNVLKIWDLELWKSYARFVGLEPKIYHLIHPNFLRIVLQFPRVLELYKDTRRC